MNRNGLLFGGMVSTVVLGIFLIPSMKGGEAGAKSVPTTEKPTPVLIELFTSEGCSDCPPADALLEKLDKSQPVAGAEVVVLSEHVDYWDDIGWKDPYSSHESTERQAAYASIFRLRSVYTPQMVVDGRIQIIGSDEDGAMEAVQDAEKSPKIPVSLTDVHFGKGNNVSLHVSAAALPADAAGKSARVIIAVADDKDESRVSRGENAGRTLSHVAVVRTLVAVGAIDKESGFSKDETIRLAGGISRNVRIVALAQDSGGRIWGVGTARVGN